MRCRPLIQARGKLAGAMRAGAAALALASCGGRLEGMTAAAAGEAGTCAPGTTRCAGSSVQTCEPGGGWSTPWACVTGVCADGACAGSRADGVSCQAAGAGMTDCGDGGESCCTCLDVPGGAYFRTYTSDGGGANGLADPATLSGFCLDKYLVTVGRFRQFVRAVLPLDGGAPWLPQAGSGKHEHLGGGRGLEDVSWAGCSGCPDAGIRYEVGWATSDNAAVAPTDANLMTSFVQSSSPCGAQGYISFSSFTWTPEAGSQETLPIDSVSWQEAYAFCIWDGGFLPSEAEWEYAAAGGGEQRLYPWGSADPGTANQLAIYDRYYPSGSDSCSNVLHIAPVGTTRRGVGRWGQLDMAGEVLEWTLDAWQPQYVTPCINCGDLGLDGDRVVRGGDFSTPLWTSAQRYLSIAADRVGIDVGFRCARAP